MDFDHIITAILLAMPATWLSIAVWENIRHPILNETFTAEVLSMKRLKTEYPNLFKSIGHRAIYNRKMQQWAFRLIVGAELTVTVALWLAVFCQFFIFDAAQANLVGQVAVLGFCVVWGSFLIAGNYFAYWMCHDVAQTTHFHMLLWGLAILIYLT